MSKNTELRALPGVDKMLDSQRVRGLIKQYGHVLVAHALRNSIESARKGIISGQQAPDDDSLINDAIIFISSIAANSLKAVINATGIAIHTNLGRAPIGKDVLQDISDVLTGYSNLEFDLEEGCRGKRDVHISGIIKYLTGAENSVIVNNNAAAIMLTLSTLAKGKEVIISRGELIEIGGSFRIPDIMSAAGVKMVEVGTTNRTRLEDYANAITSETALIFKAHQSNYSIHGFTEDADVKELSGLARSRNISLVYDIGSGLLKRPKNINMENEPDIKTALEKGADLVTFSCDKLLGGPQAGIIVGRSDLIGRLSKAPMMRALRVGKITMAVLFAACRNYLSDDLLVRSNPLFHMLNRTEDDLKNIAERVSAALVEQGVECTVGESAGQCGGGSLPDLKIKSYAVSLTTKNGEEAERIYRRLMKLDKPVIGVLRKGRLIFDVFTIFEDDLSHLISAIVTVARG